MTVYSIFEKPQGKAAKNRAPKPVPPVAVVRGLAYVSRVIGSDAAGWLYVLGAVFLGFEAAAFRRDGLLARGYIWRGDGVSTGEDLATHDFIASSAAGPI